MRLMRWLVFIALYANMSAAHGEGAGNAAQSCPLLNMDNSKLVQPNRALATQNAVSVVFNGTQVPKADKESDGKAVHETNQKDR